MTKTNPPEKNNPGRSQSLVARGLATTAFRSLGLACLVGVVAILLFGFESFSFGQYLAITGTALLISSASLVIGTLAGFLFGIPRTLEGDDDGHKTGTRYRANTNLEQISDWLTKILVGVGLTQITVIPGRLWMLAERLGQGLGGVRGSPSYALSLMGFFSITGFLLGYLWTRIYFRQVLIGSESELVSRVEAEMRFTGIIGVSLGAAALAMEDSNPQKPGALNDALDLLNQQPELFHERTVTIVMARIYRYLKDYDTALNRLDESLELRRTREIPEGEDDAALHYNRACYFNLKARQKNVQAEQEENAEAKATLSDEAEKLRTSAKEALKVSIRLWPQSAVDARTDGDLVPEIIQ